jgi:hypothetical protein
MYYVAFIYRTIYSCMYTDEYCSFLLGVSRLCVLKLKRRIKVKLKYHFVILNNDSQFFIRFSDVTFHLR